MGVVDVSFYKCDSIKSSGLSPVPASADWIVPKVGCRKVPNLNGENMIILYFSIWIEPCSGLKSDDDNPNPAQSIGPSVMTLVLSTIVGGIMFVWKKYY